ncbi:cytochrome bd-I oxidase subunit CydX [Oligella ureolytica]
MWYLTWMLGTAFACGVAIAVGLWYEIHQQRLDAGSNHTQRSEST